MKEGMGWLFLEVFPEIGIFSQEQLTWNFPYPLLLPSSTKCIWEGCCDVLPMFVLSK